MKLAKLTALQSLNQNRITEKALSRKNSSSVHNQILPFVIVQEWNNGFQNMDELTNMNLQCHQHGIDATLAPCDGGLLAQYHAAIIAEEPFLHPMCCDIPIHHFSGAGA
jgi:hypothetical protein